MKHIFVVCTGNICRSPVAEGILTARLPDHNVWSAGLAALVGEPADPASVKVARDHGIDISKHRAQQVVSWMCTQADLILVMEMAQQQQLLKQYPLTKGKVYRWGEFGNFDVQDPYKQYYAVFQSTHAQIERGASDWVKRIKDMG